MTLALFVLALAVATEGVAVELSVVPVSGACSKAVALPVAIDDAGGVLSVQFAVSFDANVLTPLATPVAVGPALSGFQVFSSSPAAGRLVVSLGSFVPAPSGAGIIAFLRFTAAGGRDLRQTGVALDTVLINDRPALARNGVCTVLCGTALPVASWIVPSTARIGGLGGTFWITDLFLRNGGSASATVVIKFLGHEGLGAAGPERILSVAAGEIVAVRDILASWYGSEFNYGPVLIQSSSASLAATAETSTSRDGGTYGQAVPAIPSAQLIGDSYRTIVGVRQDAVFRTNLVLANPTELSVDVDVALVQAVGLNLGRMTVRLPALSMKQLNVLTDFGASNIGDAAFLIGTTSPGGKVAAYASVIDSVTGDPRTLLPEMGQSSTPPAPCRTSVQLSATSVTPTPGTGVVVRAAVTEGGSSAPDGASVLFTTDFGFIGDTGSSSVSKVTQNGFADITLGALSAGLARVKATSGCATASLSIEFKPKPVSGPFISAVEPNRGDCLGGDTVVINGGRFVPVNPVNQVEYRVLFGGTRASVTGVSDTRITVRTPPRTLSSPQVPEAVDVTVSIVDGPVSDTVTASKAFTYDCVDSSRRMTVDSLVPSSGLAAGGYTVVVSGTNFLPTPGGGGAPGSSAPTTQVRFGGLLASILSVTQTSIVVEAPSYSLSDPTKSERVNLWVAVDIGLPSMQTVSLPLAFEYLSSFTGAPCNTNPLLAISSVVPGDPSTAGRPEGGDVVRISGIGFFAGYSTLPTNRIRVEFGGVAGSVASVSDTLITVTTPQRTLANPQFSETVDVTVTVDVGGPRQSCARVADAFTYRGSATGNCPTSPNVFISSVVPADPVNAGSPNGGDSVTINGSGFFAGHPTLPTSAVRVEFGGAPAIVNALTNTTIQVLTPKRVLANPQTSETVDVDLTVDVGGSGQTCARAVAALTYRGTGPPATCNTNPDLFISSVVPTDPVNAGSPDGGDQVTIRGGGFFAGYPTLAATQVCVEFGGGTAVVTSVSNTTIVVTTPRRVLANPTIPETVDVVVTVDVGGARQRCATALAAFTYRASGSAAPCTPGSNLAITSVVPVNPANAGSQNGGDRVTVNGTGFFAGYAAMPIGRVRVQFGGSDAVVNSVTDTAISVLTPPHTLADPLLSETVDVVVWVDVGGARQSCTTAKRAFTYRGAGPGS